MWKLKYEEGDLLCNRIYTISANTKYDKNIWKELLHVTVTNC